MSKLTSKKFSSVKIFQLTSLSLALSLVGCNGPVDSIDPKSNLSGKAVTDTEDGESGNGTSESAKKNAKLKISDIKLTDALTGDITKSVTTEGAKAIVTVTDKAGKPVENAIVTFVGGGVTLSSKNGAVLTNSKGEASIFLSPASGDDTSAYSMTATANYKGATVTSDAVNYSLQALNVILDEFTIAEENLELGASTLVSLVTKNESTREYKNNINVVFTTSCGTFEFPEVTSSSQGNVKNTYRSIDKNGKLCSKDQTITVTSSGGVSKTKKINIKEIQGNSIVYNDVGEKYFNTKNSGASGYGEIEFTVLANGKFASNQEVELELTEKSPDDFSFISLGNREKRILKSDASGKVRVPLYPGNIPGPVEVKASLVTNKEIFAFSRNVSVGKGRPLQRALTLAVGKSVTAAGQVKDIPVTAFVRDRQGGPAPKGTVVNFVSEGGAITPQCSTDDRGRCTVTFTTQRPHPRDGRATILAYTEGEKLYKDIDGSNTFTEGDKFEYNIGSFFRDDNENGKYDKDKGEFIYRRPLKGEKVSCGTKPRTRKQKFDEPNIPDTCDDALDTVVRTQILMGMASSEANYVIVDDKKARKYEHFKFKIYGNSVGTLPLPSGTSFTFKVDDGTPKNDLACTGSLSRGYETLPKVMDLFRVDHYATYEISLSQCTAGDRVAVEYVIPNEPKALRVFEIPKY